MPVPRNLTSALERRRSLEPRLPPDAPPRPTVPQVARRSGFETSLPPALNASGVIEIWFVKLPYDRQKMS